MNDWLGRLVNRGLIGECVQVPAAALGQASNHLMNLLGMPAQGTPGDHIIYIDSLRVQQGSNMQHIRRLQHHSSRLMARVVCVR